MEDTFSNIKEMIKANFPLLYLTTSEYSRVTQKIRTIAYGMDYAFHTWDCVDGLQTHEKDQSNKLKEVRLHANGETRDYIDFLEYIRKGLIRQNDDNKEIFLVEDFHKYFDQEQVIVSLRKLSVELKSCNKHLIFLSPFHKLPDEIEKYITVVSMPLPDRKDLQTRLKVVAGKETPINPDLEKYIIDSALGLTDTEADLAFRLAKEKVGLDKKEAIQIIANEKEQIIKKSGILDYFQVNMDLEKSVGGLDNLKLWLKQRSKSFERKAKDFGLKEPKGILLLGVPGCGKSLTAKCVATEWKQPLLRLDIGKVFQQSLLGCRKKRNPFSLLQQQIISAIYHPNCYEKADLTKFSLLICQPKKNEQIFSKYIWRSTDKIPLQILNILPTNQNSLTVPKSKNPLKKQCFCLILKTPTINKFR